MTWSMALWCTSAWLALASMVWAVAAVGAPWWGVLISLCVAAACGPTYKTGLAAVDPSIAKLMLEREQK